MLSKSNELVLLASILGLSSVCMSVERHGKGDTFFGQAQNGESCSESDDSCSVSPLATHTQDENAIEPQSKESTDQNEINVIITFTNAEHNTNLKNKFTVTVRSIFQHTSVPLVLYIIGDEKSRQIAANIIETNAGTAKFKMVSLDVDKLAGDLDDIVKPMQKHFSYKTGSYYNHALFFLSIAMHRVMPQSMHKVIMLDADLMFTEDIKKLHDRFSLFTEHNIIGIAREMQPVYRHTFWQYRSDNPNTRVGEPGPDGLTGFNSGVMLLNIDAMRSSTLYNGLLNTDAVEQLTEEFHFKGHLGDQDLFTLINMKYESLFHVLPCNWNRQLCVWWRDHGYSDVFDQYHNCEGDIKIWHGNCNTPIP